MTTSEPDGTDINRKAVYHYTRPFLSGVGAVPALGSPEWCALDEHDRRKLAAVVAAALARVVLPADLVAELRQDAAARGHKQVALDLAAAEDWHRVATRPSHAELERRRNHVEPIPGDASEAVQRWVATGSKSPPAGRDAV